MAAEPVPQKPPRALATPEPGKNAAVWARLWSPTPPRQPEVLPELVPNRRSLTPAEELRSVHRLYAQSTQRKKDALERLDKAVYGGANAPSPTLPPDECDAMVKRIYSERLQLKAAKTKKLEDKYLAKSVVHVKKIHDKEELTGIIQRLYDTSAKERERSAELFEKFNPSKPPLRRRKDEIVTNVDRWYAGGFGKKN